MWREDRAGSSVVNQPRGFPYRPPIYRAKRFLNISLARTEPQTADKKKKKKTGQLARRSFLFGPSFQPFPRRRHDDGRHLVRIFRTHRLSPRSFPEPWIYSTLKAKKKRKEEKRRRKKGRKKKKSLYSSFEEKFARWENHLGRIFAPLYLVRTIPLGDIQR